MCLHLFIFKIYLMLSKIKKNIIKMAFIWLVVAFLATNTWIVMKLKTWVKSVLWIHRKDMVWVYSLMICKPILFLIVLKTIIKYPRKSKNWKKRLVMKIKNCLIVSDIMEIPSNVKYEIRESKTFTLINNSIKITNSYLTYEVWLHYRKS